MTFWKKWQVKNRHENLDSTPLEMPMKFHRPPSLQEQLRAYTRATLNKQAALQGKETFEEANDFDVGEDLLPVSQHEIEFDARGEAAFEEFATKAFNKRKAAKEAAQKKADDAPPESTLS